MASSSLFLSLLSLFLILPFIHGHMYLSSLRIDGTAFDEGDCVRMTKSNSPISSVTSQDMTCGFRPAADTAANRRCPVKAGSRIGLQWYHERPSPSDQIVDPSHKGPCIIYLAKDDGSNNPNWFKIYEIGYDFTANEFCVAKLIRNRGLMETTIPADIEPGNYLIRGETIALHEGYRVGGAQPYVGCAEIQITGSGNARPATVKLPGAYQPTDPGLYISIYNPFTSYIVPGPAVYTSGSSPNGGNGINNGDGIKSDGGAKSGGMSAGGTAALVIFFLALAGVIVGGAFYYHKKGHIMGKTLPPSIANILPSSFGRSSSNNNNYSGGDRRDNGNYTAYVEQENL